MVSRSVKKKKKTAPKKLLPWKMAKVPEFLKRILNSEKVPKAGKVLEFLEKDPVLETGLYCRYTLKGVHICFDVNDFVHQELSQTL